MLIGAHMAQQFGPPAKILTPSAWTALSLTAASMVAPFENLWPLNWARVGEFQGS
jgi:hypothetical protein